MLCHRTTETEPKYYADGEDAYAMRRDLVDWARQYGYKPPHPEKFFAAEKKGRRQGKEKEPSGPPAVEAARTAMENVSVNAVASSENAKETGDQAVESTEKEVVKDDSAVNPDGQTATKKKNRRKK